jgi:hypothetical protein
VPDAVWEQAARHDDVPALVAAVIIGATINVWSRRNVATKQGAGQGPPEGGVARVLSESG